jgi:hypothetical protein
MKKAFIFLLFFPFLLNAQSDTRTNNIFLGIQGGLNFSEYIPLDSILESKKSTMPLIGANVTLPFNNYMNLRIGAIYSPKGTNYDVYPKPFKIRYNYLDFPVSLQVKTLDFLRIEGGVIPSVVINSKTMYGAASDSIVQIPKDGSGLEIALKIGAEITIQKGFDFGFSYEIPTSSSSFKNFCFTLTYSFNISKLTTVQAKPEEDIASRQIADMHNGVLLVRLKTSESQINALKKIGRFEDAEKLQNKQASINRDIVRAFKTNFNFCPVYFFYSSATAQIKERKISGNLLNDSLFIDSSISFEFKSFYMAEFGYLDPDTIYIGRDLYAQKSYQSDTAYSLSTTTQTEALVVRNSHFAQLKEPFPFFVSMDERFRKKSHAMAVGMLNNQLHYFFKKSMQTTNP